MKSFKILSIIGTIIVGIAIGIVIENAQQTAHYKKVESYNVVSRITILKDFINVREQPTTKSAKVFEVIKNEQYDVIEMYVEEDALYAWYKIIFSDRRLGWIASYNEVPWVEEVK